MDNEKVYIGFSNPAFQGGEEIEVEKGVVLHAVPRKCTVVKEYRDFVLIEMGFRRASFDREKGLRPIRTCVNKGAMLCGDVVIRRAADGTLLVGEEIGIMGYVPNLEVAG